MPQTGATRYQKFLKSDRAKTKLKGKKDLPKGTNVTKTNFKIKKIVVREQLKKHDDNEVLSTRKLNVKELLSRLNHFNTQSRTSALDDLRELITSHPDVLTHNLGHLIQGITPLTLNIEKTIRRESLKVLHLIMSSSSEERIEPFHDFMSTYLRSTMTHIDPRIQEDSLLFLDILLQTSVKIAQDFHKIIPNFLDMISKLRVDSKPGRTLTVNLDSQLTTVKWRVKVLHRLQQFLQKFVQYNNVNSLVQTKAHSTAYYDENKVSHYSLYNTNYTAVCQLTCFSSQNTSDNDTPQNEVDKFMTYIETLMPLLLETWLEVCPNANKEKSIETVVNEDAAILLKHILEIISLIWEVVKYLNKKNPMSNVEHVFCHKYKQQFVQHIFQAFPYVTNLRSKKSREASMLFEDVITDPKLVLQNLELCHLFIVLNPNINIKTQNKDMSCLLNYVERNFNYNANADVLMKLLHKLFSDITGWTKNVAIMKSLFEKIVAAYFNENLEKSFRQKLFALLCKIALNDKLTHFQKSDVFENWLKRLPDILLGDSVTVQTVDIIHMFAVRNSRKFNIVIKPQLVKVIENLPKIVISDMSSELDLLKLYSILYRIKCWDDNTLRMIESQLLCNAYKCHSKYIYDIFASFATAM